MELLWIFLLIFNGYVANANKPECCKEECSQQCVVFNVPCIMCVTPNNEYATVPQNKNLLCNGCSVSLCDLLCQVEPYKTECCKPKPYNEPPKPVCLSKNNVLAQAATTKTSNHETNLEGAQPEGEKEDTEGFAPPDGAKFNCPLLLISPLPSTKPPPCDEQATKTPPCDEQPSKTPPWNEQPTKTPPWNEPPTKTPPWNEPPTKSPPCVEPPKPPKSPYKPCCIPQNAPPSSFVYPDSGCGCYPPLYVNPRYLSELFSLYGPPNNDPIDPYNHNYFNPTDQGNFGQTCLPNVPNGQPQFSYNNPGDKMLTKVSSKNEPDNFDQDCMNKFCSSYPPPKPEPIPNYFRGNTCNSCPNYDQKPDNAEPPPCSNVDGPQENKEVEPTPEENKYIFFTSPKYMGSEYTVSNSTVSDSMFSPDNTEKTDNPEQMVRNSNDVKGEQNEATKCNT